METGKNCQSGNKNVLKFDVKWQKISPGSSLLTAQNASMTTICPFDTPPRGTSSTMAPMAPFKHPPGYPRSSPVFIGSNPPVTPQSSLAAKTPVDSEKGGAWWVESPIRAELYHANSPIGTVRKQLFPNTEKKESLVEIIAMQAHDELTESVVKRALGDNYY
jgi:hypothetical protein